MNDSLDKLLKDWSSRHELAEQSRDRLERRIALKMREARRELPSAVPESRVLSSWGRLGWFALGAACSLVTIVVMVRFPSPGRGNHAAELARSSESISGLFHEVDRLFAGNLRWIAQADGKVELGIDPENGVPAHGNQPFAVHIAVVSRTGADGAWKKAWESDIVTWSEQAIDITPDPKHDNRVALWIYPVEDGRFAVDSRMSLNTPVRISSESGDVVQEGKPTSIAVMTIGSKEYRVYQTVTRLKVKEDGPC